ncbi:MAG: GntR family transcriptional regulator [Actinomycetota bacterium]|nr:GntR family transcriptional regulator [Actinomycetota bacterium]
MEAGDARVPRAPAARRGRLTEVAYQHLRDVILRGTLPVGSVLAESEIAAELKISRTPVRQALGLLLQEGLVEVGARRQLIVRGFSEEHRREILLLREALEGTAVRHAADVIDLDDVDLLRLILIRQRRAANEGREEDFIDLDEQFHLKIAEEARLPILYGFLSQLRGFVRLMRVAAPRHPSHMTEVVAEHEALVDALERHDSDAAAAALSHHLQHSHYAT